VTVHLSEPSLSALGRLFAGAFSAVASSVRLTGRLGIPGAPSGNVGAWIAQSLGINRLPSWWGPLMGILVGKESGGNPRAYNPVSVLGQHAEGVAQMLPSTFAAYSLGGSIWNPVANLVSAERYIRAVYGNPRNIAGLFGGTYYGYDSGGVLPPGRSLAYNGTGRPEMVVPARGGTGGNVTVHVHAPVGSNPREIGRVLSEYLLAFQRGGGRVLVT